jgi:hypothetical protein
MAIEAYRAAEKQLAAEKRAEQFPGLDIATRLASKVADLAGLELPQFLELAAEAMQKNSTANLAYLHEWLVREVEHIDLSIGALVSAGEAEKQALNEVVSEVVARAAEAKSRDRIERIARILVNSLRSGPKQNYERERELIDTAVQVADHDASVLGVMMKYQGATVKNVGIADINNANQTWKKMSEENEQFRGPRIHVSCARLQAQGLVIRMDRTPTGLDLATNAYSLTEFGVEFCEWCLVALEK